MRFTVTFKDIISDVKSEEHAYEILLKYLRECVNHEDVIAFDFEEIKE